MLLNSCVINNRDIIFSDYVLNPIGRYEVKGDISFSNKNLTSDLLLEYLDHNALNLKTNKRINYLIKKSKRIYLSVGMNDLLEYVSLVDNKLVFSSTLMSQKIALLEYNVHEIISSILAIKEVEIYYLSLYYLNDDCLDSLIGEYNFDIKEVLEGLNVNYVDINEVIKVNNFMYEEGNQKKLYKYLGIS